MRSGRLCVRNVSEVVAAWRSACQPFSPLDNLRDSTTCHEQTTEADSSLASTTQFLRFNSQPRQPPPGMRVFDRVLEFPCIFDIKVWLLVGVLSERVRGGVEGTEGEGQTRSIVLVWSNTSRASERAPGGLTFIQSAFTTS